MKEILQQTYFGNTIQDYLIAFGVILLLMILIRIIRNIALKQLRIWASKTETTLDDFLVHATEKALLPILNLAAIFAGLHYLSLSDRASRVLHAALAIAITFFVVRLINAALQHAFEEYMGRQEEGDAKKKQVRGIMVIVRALVWVLGAIFLLDNLGFDITAIVAGLGIGGIAIALAAQTILGDLFSYFVIFFDRPFEIGDFITVDDKRGTVEYIGIKTTRIRSITGEQLVISNTNLTNSRVHNFKKMQRRRIVFNIGVTYQTPAAKLARIPEIIKQLITEHPDATFDRAHFAAFGDFSLNFEVVYFVENADYMRYMEIQQDINLKLYEIFEQEGIEFAYPTQTVFLEKAQPSS